MAAGATVDQEWIGQNAAADTPLSQALRRDARMRAALSIDPR
jgi:hypothetical protein